MGILKEQFNHGGMTKSGLLIDGVKQSKTAPEKLAPQQELTTAQDPNPKSKVAITTAEKV